MDVLFADILIKKIASLMYLVLAAHPDDAVDHDLLTRAMAYGTALASFNVEEFGTERVAVLTPEEIEERVAVLERITRFEHRAVALKR